MHYWPASTILQVPEHSRQIIYDSGVFMVNDCFLPLFEEYHYRFHLWGARGSGKSHVVSDYVDYLLSQPDYCRIMLLRYIRDDIRRSIWKDFIDRITERGRVNEYRISYREMVAVHKATGNELTATGVKSTKAQTAKLKSIAGYSHVVMEESDEIPKEDKTKLIDSVRKKDVKIQIIEMFNTPRKSHYIWDDYTLTPTEYDGYYRATPTQQSGIYSIWTDYHTNRHNLNEEWLKRYDNGNTAKDLNWYLTDVRGLIPSGNKGAIYKGWNRISLEEYNRLEYNKYYVNDWGTNDPNALIEIKVYQNTIMARGLLYRPIELQPLAIFLCQKGFTEKELILCDSAQPQAILALRGFDEQTMDASLLFQYPQLRKGFNTVGVPKPPGSILDGIRMLQGYEVYVVEDEESEHIWNEYVDYMWELDKDGKPTDQPVDKNNHYMDCMRYFAYVRNNL